jgi:hypothetical protein
MCFETEGDRGRRFHWMILCLPSRSRFHSWESTADENYSSNVALQPKQAQLVHRHPIQESFHRSDHFQEWRWKMVPEKVSWHLCLEVPSCIPNPTVNLHHSGLREHPVPGSGPTGNPSPDLPLYVRATQPETCCEKSLFQIHPGTSLTPPAQEPIGHHSCKRVRIQHRQRRGHRRLWYSPELFRHRRRSLEASIWSGGVVEMKDSGTILDLLLLRFGRLCLLARAGEPVTNWIIWRLTT